MSDDSGPGYSIAEQLMFTTVRIETESPKGDAGVGTGFIYSVPVGDDREAQFLVTNKHVIQGAKKGLLTFTVAEGDKPALGKRYALTVDDFEDGFVGHEDPDVDVAVLPFIPIINHLTQQGVSIFYRSIPDSLIPTQEQLEELDALEDIVFIGYPNGIWDSQNNLPVIRRGITATPISIDFQREPTFLVDASVFPGSSGSPVFLYNMGTYVMKNQGTVVGSRIMFLGVISSVFFQQDTGEIRIANIPTESVPIAIVRQMLDLGIVFKSRTVQELARKIVSG